MSINKATETDFRIWRSLRLSTFQIASAIGEILTASVWNRVMIADLNMPATPVGLLLALQYLLMPVSFWAGHRSDTKLLWGRRRASYIWLGRGVMVLSMPLLGFSVRRFEAGDPALGWALAFFCFLLFGLGKLFSGSVYLALVRESAPASKQGIAIGLAETMLIAFFPLVAIAFGRWMEHYDPQTFGQMILISAVLGAFFWWFAIVRVERKTAVHSPVTAAQNNWNDLVAKFKEIWQDVRVRRFFGFLSLATFAAWMQDNVLEPFGADVFRLEAGDTTRFTGYWGGATIVTLIICFVVWRQRRPEQQSGVTKIGLAVMAVGMLMLAALALADLARLLVPALLIFGLGFGLYTFGGLSLMAVMSPDKDAGAYLGLWTVSILFFKGLGTFLGGVLRDLFFLAIGWSGAASYGIVFALAAVGLLTAVRLLNAHSVLDFARENDRVLPPQVVEAVSAD